MDNPLNIRWTAPAQQQVLQMNDPRFQGNPQQWHEERVRDYANQNLPHATTARIRKPAHFGGADPTEPEHITVTFKDRNRDMGAHHVYTNGQ